MAFTTSLRERLAGGAAAIGVQAGLVALLVLSFQVVRNIDTGKETILVLPPLPRAVLKPAIVIDGRPRPAPAPAAPVPQVQMPAPPAAETSAPQAAPPPAAAMLRDLGRSLSDCRPEKLGDLPPAARAACAPVAPQARKDDNDVQLGNNRVKDEDYYAAEKAQRDAPLALPGAGAGPLGILLTALFNPSAFADKHNYNYGPPLPPRDGEAAAGGAPPRQHASDAAFQQALAAANARRRGLYDKPAPPAAPDAGAAP